MKKFSLSAVTGITLAATSCAAIATIAAPAQAFDMDMRPIDWRDQDLQTGQTAKLSFASLPADPQQPLGTEYEALGKNYLSLGLTNLGNRIRFTLNNTVNNVPANFSNRKNILSAAIEAVYFHDTNSLLGKFIGFTKSGSRVNFTSSANPSNIPNALNSYPSPFESKWSAQAKKPSGAPGLRTDYAVHGGESLAMDFELTGNNGGFNEVLDQMDKGNFRVGLNVVGLGKNKNLSATYENVPEPFTILGSGVALGFGALFKRATAKAKLSKKQASKA